MKLHYLKEDAVIQLRENMLNNIHNYQNTDSWIDSYLTEELDSDQWYLESRISYKKANLIIPKGSNREASKTDAENSKRIHRSMKNLTPAQAIDPRIWTYLTHNVYQEYMSARWLQNQNEISKGTIERYFANSNRELIRNGIARLWWYGWLTYDPSRDDPYELTDFLLSNQNIAQGMLERTIGNNKEWLVNILDVILKYKNEYPSVIHSDNIKKFTKYLNFSGGVTLLDCLDKPELENFFLQWILKEKLPHRALAMV